MANILYKGPIGKEDINWGIGTFTRRGSLGTVIMTKVPSGHEYDALIDYGGSTAFTTATINAALAAIDTTAGTLLLRPGTWAVTSNITIPANVALEVPKGAILAISTGVTLTINGPFEAGDYQVFSCTGTGAVSGLKESHPEWFGAKHDGVTDDTAAIRAAIASTNGPVIFYPSATYIVTLATDSEEPTKHYVAYLKSNMYLYGNGATIKLKDNESTNASPKHFNIFKKYDLAGLHDIYWQDLIIDENGLNNLINNPSPSIYSCAALWLGGTAAKYNITIRNCEFKNNPGSNTIVIMEGYDIRIIGNKFTEQGVDTWDHTSVNLSGCYRAWVQGNRFYNATNMHNANGESSISAELHGPQIIYSDNNVYNYRTGVLIGSTKATTTRTTERTSVYNNTFYVLHSGVTVWRGVASPTCSAIDDVKIHDNVILLTDEDHGHAEPKAGINITPAYSVSNVQVYNNKISKPTFAYFAVGIWVKSTTSGETVDDVSLFGNEISGTTHGIYIQQTNATGRLNRISVRGNLVKNIKENTEYTPESTIYGILMSSDVATTSPWIVANNTIDNTESDSTVDVGVSVSTSVTGALSRGNIFAGLLQDKYGYNYASGATPTAYWNLTDTLYVILSATCEFTFVAPPKQDILTMQLVQDGAVARIVTWPGSVKWVGGSAPVLSVGANKVDVVTFVYDGTSYMEISRNLDVR